MYFQFLIIIKTNRTYNLLTKTVRFGKIYLLFFQNKDYMWSSINLGNFNEYCKVAEVMEDKLFNNLYKSII